MGFLYLVHDDCKRLIYGFERIGRERIADVLLAEHALRELSQREETLHHRVMALQKTIAIESDRLQPDKTTPVESTRAELEKTNQQLKEFQLQYARKEYALYQATSMLTSTVRIEVDVAAGNVDAAHRDCCIGFRGFEFPEEDKEEIRRDFKARVELRGSGYFIKLADWSFCPLKRQKPSNPKSQWYRIFGMGSTDEKES
ncbi:hypothetical protein PENNAL_c0001G08597 [Penicillium nalgiovense]|uniref:Uncharacterized protein n=1 Tax=Penicillium nalgiovense TaxID=60175 RepID=A0A1V6ZA07_PENNA|nr:hypothetical protein PENNAL_c0001G08597 [Penicillium nalgiovense]